MPSDLDWLESRSQEPDPLETGREEGTKRLMELLRQQYPELAPQEARKKFAEEAGPAPESKLANFGEAAGLGALENAPSVIAGAEAFGPVAAATSPFLTPVGGFASGAVAAFGAGLAARKAQQAITKAVRPEAQQESDAIRRENPKAYKTGAIASQLIAAKIDPSLVGGLAKQLMRRGAGAGIGAGLSAVQDVALGERPSLEGMAEGAALGALTTPRAHFSDMSSSETKLADAAKVQSEYERIGNEQAAKKADDYWQARGVGVPTDRVPPPQPRPAVTLPGVEDAAPAALENVNARIAQSQDMGARPPFASMADQGAYDMVLEGHTPYPIPDADATIEAARALDARRAAEQLPPEARPRPAWTQPQPEAQPQVQPEPQAPPEAAQPPQAPPYSTTGANQDAYQRLKDLISGNQPSNMTGRAAHDNRFRNLYDLADLNAREAPGEQAPPFPPKGKKLTTKTPQEMSVFAVARRALNEKGSIGDSPSDPVEAQMRAELVRRGVANAREAASVLKNGTPGLTDEAAATIARQMWEGGQKSRDFYGRAGGSGEGFWKNDFGRAKPGEPVTARGVVGDTLNIAKALMTGFDASFIGRQGIGAVGLRPSAIPKAMKTWATAMLDEGVVTHLDEMVKQSPYAQQHMADGGFFSDQPNSKVGQKADQYLGASKAIAALKTIPVVGKYLGRGYRATERANTAYLNKFRLDAYTGIAKEFEASGMTPQSHPAEYKALSTLVNAATGHGNLGALEQHVKLLNGAFFSPRLMASRLYYLNPMTYVNTPGPVRMLAARSALGILGTGLAAGQLLKLAGAKTESDPNSPNWGKYQIGQTRIDMYGGHQQFARFIYQMLPYVGGNRKTESGATVPINRLELALRFARTKMSPGAGLIADLLAGQNLIGQSNEAERMLGERTIPMLVQDMYDVTHSGGSAFGAAAAGVASFAGLGVQTYGEPIPPDGVVKTPAENALVNFGMKHVGESTADEKTKRSLRGALTDQLRRGEDPSLTLSDAVKNGSITPQEAMGIIKSAKLDQWTVRFKGLPLDEAEQVYKQARHGEQVKWGPIIDQKRAAEAAKALWTQQKLYSKEGVGNPLDNDQRAQLATLRRKLKIMRLDRIRADKYAAANREDDEE